MKQTNNWHLIYFTLFPWQLSLKIFCGWQNDKAVKYTKGWRITWIKIIWVTWHPVEQKQRDTKTSIKTAKHQIICHANMETVITLLSSVLYNEDQSRKLFDKITLKTFWVIKFTHRHMNIQTDRQTDGISFSTLSVRQNVNILSRSHTTQYRVLTNHQHTTTPGFALTR